MLPDRYTDAAKAAFMNEATYGSTLFAILVDTFNNLEFINWDPEVIQSELQSDLGIKFRDCPPENQDKLMMMIGVYGTNLFYQSLEFFLHACNAFSNSTVLPHLYDPATVEEMAWAVMEVAMQQVEDEKDMGKLFNDEIKAYVGQQASDEGFADLPDILAWGNKPPRADNGADPAALGAGLFAASFQDDREKIITVNTLVATKTRELGVELAKFPFLRRPKEA